MLGMQTCFPQRDDGQVDVDLGPDSRMLNETGAAPLEGRVIALKMVFRGLSAGAAGRLGPGSGR